MNKCHITEHVGFEVPTAAVANVVISRDTATQTLKMEVTQLTYRLHSATAQEMGAQ
jgi:hypothetical protein